jgi:hypothetical protein
MRDDDDERIGMRRSRQGIINRWRISKNVNYVDVVLYIHRLFVQNLYCISIVSVKIRYRVLVMSREPN